MRDEIRDQIKTVIEKNRVVLFMKGSKNFPQCGFSARAVEALKRAGAEFETVNVLADQEIREGIKEFSAWPTVPQVYIDGQFVGGSDIVLQLFESGELAKLVKATPQSS
jgi:monothiol glutaredoxin